MSEDIPQIVAIVSISPDGKMNLKKAVREHLGVEDAQRLFLDMQDEITLSAQEGTGKEISVIKGKQIYLPKEVLGKLEITQKSPVGLVQRKNAVAIKKIKIEEREGEWARIVDLETTYKITRRAETNPMPEKLLLKLEEKHKNSKLRYNVKNFLKGRQTLEAWEARQILGITETSDEELRKKLVRNRLKKQREDGSWEGSVTITARNLRELADLGMSSKDKEIQHSVKWVMDRPQSPYNPGMFFATDELVKEQEEVIERRRKQTSGTRDRFNKRKSLEVRLVKAGDDLIDDPCGPRIMWTTALVLEALLKLGYEDSERVQAALRMLSLSRWCDNAQQHGLSGTGEIKRTEPYSMEEIETIEKECIQRFRYGGLSSIKALERADMAHIPFYMPRITHNPTPDGDEYPLRMLDTGGGCPMITTRALNQVKDKKLRRLAEAHLWEFVGGHHFPFESYFFLKLWASYNHPISEMAIMRSIPWIINNQNEDGSWGDESTKDASTLAAISALKRVGLTNLCLSDERRSHIVGGKT